MPNSTGEEEENGQGLLPVLPVLRRVWALAHRLPSPQRKAKCSTFTFTPSQSVLFTCCFVMLSYFFVSVCTPRFRIGWQYHFFCPGEVSVEDLANSMSVKALDGCPVSKSPVSQITHKALRLTMQPDHSEEVQFYVLSQHQSSLLF